MKLFGKPKTSPGIAGLGELKPGDEVMRLAPEERSDRFMLKEESDGSYGPCFFCASPVRNGEDFAVLMVERMNPQGDPIHAVCHGACAERARTSR